MQTFPSPKEKRGRIADVPFSYEDQPKAYRQSCNLSSANDLVTISHVDRYGYPAKAALCLSSGLTFLNPVMTREAYSAFYRDTYRPLVSAYHNRLIDAASIQDEQRLYALQLIDFAASELRDRKVRHLLDIGGSTGVVAEAFVRAFGGEAMIVDPAPDELAYARDSGMKVIPGFIEDAELEKNAFDFVMICQSVDHLLDVDAVLSCVRNSLADEGLFFIDIVDFRAAYLRNHSIEEAIKVDHPYYFTQETITAYFKKHGFRAIKTNFAADHLHIGFLCRKCDPTEDYLPSSNWIDLLVSEIRWIQNTPRLGSR